MMSFLNQQIPYQSERYSKEKSLSRDGNIFVDVFFVFYQVKCLLKNVGSAHGRQFYECASIHTTQLTHGKLTAIVDRSPEPAGKDDIGQAWAQSLCSLSCDVVPFQGHICKNDSKEVTRIQSKYECKEIKLHLYWRTKDVLKKREICQIT